MQIFRSTVSQTIAYINARFRICYMAFTQFTLSDNLLKTLLWLLVFLYCLDAHRSNKVETPGVDRSETLVKFKFKLQVVRINTV